MKIPIISEDTIAGFYNSVENNIKCNNSNNEMALDSWQRIHDSNSDLVEYILVTSNNYADKDMQSAFLEGAWIVLELMSRQLEADEIKKQWG